MTGGAAFAGLRGNDAVFFDGVGNYLARGSDLDGNVDSKKFTFNFWFKRSSFGSGRYLYANTGSRFQIAINEEGDEKIKITAKNTSGTVILSAKLATAFTAGTAGNWYNILGSVDLSNASNRYIYINDSTDATTWSTYTNDTIDFTRSNHWIGAGDGGSGTFWVGDVYDFWLGSNQAVVLSTTANRRKFISDTGNPVPLGGNGSLPTGVAPIVFQSGLWSGWHTNKGSGGGFTQSGTLTLSTETPYN